MKKLWKNKKGLLLSLACVTLAALTGGIVLIARGCKKNEEPVNYENDGSYYFSAVDGDYSLSMSVGHCTLTVGNVTKFGTYDWEGDVMQFMFEDGTTATGTVANGNMSLVYNNATLVFLKKTEYTVSYSVENAVASTVKVLNGKTISKPADPTKDGYYFVGWYTDAEYKTPFMFDATPILADTTLYARFVEVKVGQNEFNVTYVVDGEEYKTTTTKGGVVYDLPTPVKENATFVGWWVSDYQDGVKLTYQYTNQVLTESTNLYAVWASSAPQVSVNANGVKWNAVGAGTNYTVNIYLNGTNVATNKTTSLEYAYDFSTKSAGNYQIDVAADGVTTTVYYQNKALDRVSLFTVAEPSVLVYNAVENAQKYVITVDCGNDEHVHTEIDNGLFTTFNFANCEMQKGGITFTVKAIANGYMSSESDVYTYVRNLDAITGIAFDSEAGILRWNPVAKATSYKVEVTVGDDTDYYEVYDNDFSLTQYTGDVSVKVYATANGYNSSMIQYSYNCAKLVAPTGLSMNYNTLKWNAVEGATKYNVRIGNTVYNTTATEFALPDDYRVKGESYNVSVQAVGATEEATSYYCDEITVQYGMFNNVYYGNGALNWGSVGGAYKYVVTVNDNSEVNGSETTYEAGVAATELVFKKAGANKVVVKALDYLGKTLDSKELSVETTEVVFDTRTVAGVTKMYKAVGDRLNVEDPALEGYDFAGWYNVPGGAANNGAKLESMVFTGKTANMFYAYWNPKAYEVTLKVGEETVGTATVYYGNEYTLMIPQSPDVAKAFGGWFAQDGSQGRQYTNPNGESANVWDSTSENTTLYAGWIDVLAYELIRNGAAYQVTQAAGIQYVKEVTIPETYEGKPVLEIAPGAFSYCRNLETVNIPDTIESVFVGTGSIHATSSSFYKCENLKYINVYCVDGEHVEDADHETYFSSVDGVLLRHNSPNTALEYGTELYFFPAGRTGDYTVPSVVNYIYQNAFYKSGISSVIIPASVQRIAKQAFKESKSLENVIFTEAVAGEEEVDGLVLEDNVFGSCSVLTSVTFPSRLDETQFMNSQTFLYSYKLTELNVNKKAGGNKFYTSINGMLCDKEGVELLYCPTGRVGEVEIPVAIQEIGANAFNGCTKITKVIIGDNVRKVGENAFYNCQKLDKIDFRGESGTMEIGEKAFYGCSLLTEVEIPVNVTKIAAHAFGNTANLRRVTLNGGADIQYADSAFASTDGLGYVTHLTIGETLGSFEVNGVFKGCEIERVTLEGTNPNYVAEDGALYTTGKYKILFYPFGQAEETFEFDPEVREIGAGAFYGKTNLKYLTIPKEIVAIGSDAFKGAIALATVTFEDNRTTELTLGNNVFDGCSALTAIELPEMTKSIGDSVFNKCMSLSSVQFPASLVSMGNYVFTECSKLASVTVVNGNETLAAKDGILYAKTGNDLTDIKFVPQGLKGAIVLPKTLREIPANQFKGHTGITKISFEDNTVTSENFAIGASAFESMTALTEIVLPANLKVIPNYAFRSATKLAKVNVPNTVVEIGEGAFIKAAKLQITFEEGGTEDLTIKAPTSSDSSKGVFYGIKAAELKLPERMTKIPARCFYQSTITKVVIPSTVTEIGAHAFNQCKGLTEIVFAKDANGERALHTVGNNAFSNCTALKEVTIPGSIATFALQSTTWHQTFYTCTALTTVIMEEGWTKIPTSAFNGCSKLTTFKTLKADGTVVDGMPSSIEMIETQAFMNCKALTTLKLSDNLSSIGNSVFSGCAALVAIEIPASVKMIDKSAFISCTSLATLTFEEGSKIESIGDNAFKGAKIETVTIPANVDNKDIVFGTGIFEGCTSLTSATVSASVKDLNNAFLGCSALTTINYNAAGTQVDAANKVILNATGDTIMLYYGTDEVFTVPATVTEIGKGAFAAKASLKTVNLHENVTTIHDYAFQNCTNLATLNIPATSKLTQIGAEAFAGAAITELTLPASLVMRESSAGLAVGKRAFYNNTKLTTVVVNGTAMGQGMFEGCTALTSVTLNDDITTFYGTTFKGAAFTSIHLPNSLTTVGESEFENCTKLTSVTLPANLQVGKSYDKPGYAMFKGCTELKTVTLNEGLKYIAGNMFQNCKNLSNIEIPEGVEVISTYAFTGCKALTSLAFPNTLKTIESYSFSGSSTAESSVLTEFDISNTQVTSIPGYMMSSNTALKTIKLPMALTSLPATSASAWRGATNLETFIAPGVTNIAIGASLKGSKLSTVVLSDKLTTIGSGCFENCKLLTSFDFPDTLNSIGATAFKNSGITSANLGTNVTTIGKNAFDGSAISEVFVPAATSSIGAGAFANCKNLAKITVDPANAYYRSGSYGELYDVTDTLVAFPAKSAGEDGYVEIAEGVQLSAGAFEGNVNVQYVSLPVSLVHVPDNLFLNSGVRSVVIPSGVRSLGVNVFEGCKSLEMIEIPDTVAEIGNYAFKNCTSLRKVVLPEYLEVISLAMFEGCSSLVEVELPALLRVIDARAFMGTSVPSLDCGEHLEEVGTFAFQNAKIQTINLGNSLKTMGMGVFQGSALTSVTIPASIVQIGVEDMRTGNNSQAFMDCTELTTVVFEGAPQILYKETFKGCTKLSSVTLKGEWTEIPEGTFQGCTALTEFTIPATVTTIGKNAFEGSGLTSIVIPASVKEFGVAAPSGGGGMIIRAAIPVGGGVKLNSLAFANCTALETVVFEGVPTSMNGGTFKGCTALTSVTLNGAWKEIEASMFEGCTSLTNFTIPATVTKIGADAFKGWTAEQTINVPDKTEAEAIAVWGANWNGSATVVYKQETPAA